MPLYEHVFVARQDLSGAQAEGLTEHFAAILSEQGGKMIDADHRRFGEKAARTGPGDQAGAVSGAAALCREVRRRRCR
jgi:ABC-type phosphate/phosphonate transport system substrate-binding protein